MCSKVPACHVDKWTFHINTVNEEGVGPIQEIKQNKINTDFALALACIRTFSKSTLNKIYVLFKVFWSDLPRTTTPPQENDFWHFFSQTLTDFKDFLISLLQPQKIQYSTNNTSQNNFKKGLNNFGLIYFGWSLMICFFTRIYWLLI